MDEASCYDIAKLWLSEATTLSNNLQSSGISDKFNPQTYTRRWHKGREGVDGSLPCVFHMLQYFETILPSVESLWSSLQDEVYFVGGGAAGGLWRADIWLICTVAHEIHYFSKCIVKLWSVSILSWKQCTVKQLLLLVILWYLVKSKSR